MLRSQNRVRPLVLAVWIFSVVASAIALIPTPSMGQDQVLHDQCTHLTGERDDVFDFRLVNMCEDKHVKIGTCRYKIGDPPCQKPVSFFGLAQKIPGISFEIQRNNTVNFSPALRDGEGVVYWTCIEGSGIDCQASMTNGSLDYTANNVFPGAY